MNDCRVCGHSGAHPNLQAPERMFATHKVFDYFRCLDCGCLQIKAIPSDLATYYPQNYYAYHAERGQGWRAVLRKWRNQGLLNDSLMGQFLNLIQPFEALKALRRVPISQQSHILDLGCGQGQLVMALLELGFKHVRGLDPFLPAGLTELEPYISRGDLQDLKPGWDLIMLHHSFEHLPDPHAVFRQVYQALKTGGWLLLRIPTVDSWAYEHYGTSWVQWDPPRHLYLFSRQNLKDLADQYRFKLVLTQDDANTFQFLGSETYRQNLPLIKMRGSLLKRLYYAFRARHLNRLKRGDQLICLLQKK